MEQRDEELAKELLPQNPELKAAYDEHARLNDEVDKLTAKSYLSPTEELEKKELQKRKLIEKDKIMRILAVHRDGRRTSDGAV